MFPKPISEGSVVVTVMRIGQAQTQTQKKLSWEELKRKWSLGLFFSFNERYCPGNECWKSLLLPMVKDDAEQEDEKENFIEHAEPEITLQELCG